MRNNCTCLMPTLILLALFCFPVLGLAQTQVVVDFEDDFGQVQIPDGYGGIASWGSGGDWDYWSIIGSDDNYQAHSGVHTAYSFGLGVPIQFGDDYIFEGAWMSGPALLFETLVYELYLDGALVHTSEEFVIESPPQWCASGYGDVIDELRVWQNANFAIFVMDDFTYTVPGVATESLSLSAIKALYR